MMEKKVNDVTNQNHQPAPFGPGVQGRMLGAPGAINAGAVSIEQERAIAEAQGQLVLAKRFPRDLTSAHAELMISCKSMEFARTAFYSVPNRGSGPSIRMAEEIARTVGNFQYGHRELSRTDGKSEIEVFAWDMEKNNRSIRQVTVLHVRDTKNGSSKLTDQADIDNRIANVASKQMRGRILALVPKWLVADAVAEAKKTLAGDNSEPLEVRVRKMTQAFAKYGVSAEHLEKHLGHKLDSMLLDEMVELQGTYNSLREGTPASEIFGQQDKEPAQSGLVEAAKTGAAAKAAATPAAADPAPAATTTTAEAAAPAAQPAPEKPAKVAKAKAAEAAPAQAQAPSPAAKTDDPADPAPAAGGHIADAEDIF